MSDSDDEREMIRKHKIAQVKASNAMTDSLNAAAKASKERIRIENEREDKLFNHAESILGKPLGRFKGLSFGISNNTLKTTKDIDDFIKKNNFLPESTKPIKPKKVSDKKAKLLKEIDDAIALVEGIKVPKKIKKNKIIDESIAMIDKLLVKMKKPKAKAMAKTEYKHVAKTPSSKVMDYVHEFINILDAGKTKASITRMTNKLRSKFMETARPSEVSDANSLIKEYRESNVKEEAPKAKKAIVMKETTPDDKKYKQCETYLKNQIKKGVFPPIEDVDMKYICEEASKKGFKTMSKKFVQEILNE